MICAKMEHEGVVLNERCILGGLSGVGPQRKDETRQPVMKSTDMVQYKYMLVQIERTDLDTLCKDGREKNKSWKCLGGILRYRTISWYNEWIKSDTNNTSIHMWESVPSKYIIWSSRYLDVYQTTYDNPMKSVNHKTSQGSQSNISIISCHVEH